MPDRYAQSRLQNERARRTLAGGVASSIRAAQLPIPISFASGHGSHLTDVDGNAYVDYDLGYGPMLLGHSPEKVLEAVRRQLNVGIGYGASHRLEAELSEAVCRTVPCAELCVFASTGSDAVATAVRIARAATGRTRVVKFLGHFHGWLDPLAIGQPGHGAREPGTSGQDPLASENVMVCPWNDELALATALGSDVAAVIMEPVAVNGGCFSPHIGYLEAVRRRTRDAGVVLIFDEVITGYRLALGGAQQRLGVTPDLAVLGKAMGAGFPISAVCGRADVMEVVADARATHLGTFNANPICAVASLAAIEQLEADGETVYGRLETVGTRLAGILRSAATESNLPLVVNQLGGAAYAFWSDRPVCDYFDALQADGDGYRRFAQSVLDEGVHVIPRGLLYASTAHTDADLDVTEESVRRALVMLAAEPSRVG